MVEDNGIKLYIQIIVKFGKNEADLTNQDEKDAIEIHWRTHNKRGGGRKRKYFTQAS